MKSKELRAKRFKLIEDARALMTGPPKDGKPDPNFVPSAEDNAKFDAMMAEADALKAQIDRIERADAAEAGRLEAMHVAARANGISTDEQQERVLVEEGAFGAWLRRGAGALNEVERDVYRRCFEAPANSDGVAPGGWRLSPRPRNEAQLAAARTLRDIRAALGVTSDPAGGYTVPQGFYDLLIDAQKAYGGMTDASFVFDTNSGNALPIPTDNDTSNKGAILGESTQVTTQDVTFGAVTMNAYTYSSKLVLVSNQLLQDTAFNLDAWLSGKLGVRIARITNDHFTTGTGASQPTGVITGATLGFTAGGSTSSGSTTTFGYDDLIELEHSVDPAYRKNARFMLSDAALKVTKKLKDGIGRPLWMAGLAVKEPDTINAYPYTINQSMDSPAASAKPVAFGDFMNYFIRRVAGVQILRLTERYADFNQVGFLAFQRWDGQLVDAGTHPIKYLQNSAT